MTMTLFGIEVPVVTRVQARRRTHAEPLRLLGVRVNDPQDTVAVLEPEQSAETDTLVGVPVVLTLTGWSQATLFRRLKARAFVEPLRGLGKRLAWRLVDVRAWIDRQ
jgi:predicted DNA-binding transcriptional regulator AlpA